MGSKDSYDGFNSVKAMGFPNNHLAMSSGNWTAINLQMESYIYILA